MPIGGVTAPATAAGTVMLAHAEVLAFVTLMQSFYPGCPLIYCPFPVFADPRTGITNYWDPRGEWMYCASLQLGRRTGLPCFGSNYLFSLVSVPDLSSGGGMLETSTVLSFEQLVIDAERVRDARISASPQDTGPEALAMDVIRRVGPGAGSTYEVHDRTRDDETPTQRSRREARREARRILETHRVEPLPEELEAALLKIATGHPRAMVA